MKDKTKIWLIRIALWSLVILLVSSYFLYGHYFVDGFWEATNMTYGGDSYA